MSTPLSYKVCPRCTQPAVLSAQECGRCGHQFRTQFTPVDKTQAFNVPPPSPQQPAYPQQPAFSTPGYPAFAPPKVGTASGGPQDPTEWTLSCVWNWTGLFIVSLVLAGALRGLFESARIQATATSTMFLLISLPLGALATFLILRIRRLYVYYTFGKTRWWLPASVLGALFLVCVFAPATRDNRPIDAANAERNAIETSKLVTFGMKMQTVRQRLGEPSDVQRFSHDYVTEETWYYNCPDRRVQIVFDPWGSVTAVNVW